MTNNWTPDFHALVPTWHSRDGEHTIRHTATGFDLETTDENTEVVRVGTFGSLRAAKDAAL